MGRDYQVIRWIIVIGNQGTLTVLVAGEFNFLGINLIEGRKDAFSIILNDSFFIVHSCGCDLWMYFCLTLFQAVSYYMKLETVRGVWVVLGGVSLHFVIFWKIVIEVI